MISFNFTKQSRIFLKTMSKEISKLIKGVAVGNNRLIVPLLAGRGP